MFGETEDVADEGDAKEDSKADANASARFDGLDRSPTPGDVDKCSIVEYGGGLIWSKRQETPVGTIGHGTVGIQCVVPMVECGLVEVDIVDYGIATVVAAGEGNDFARIQEVHRWSEESSQLRVSKGVVDVGNLRMFDTDISDKNDGRNVGTDALAGCSGHGFG